MGIKTGCGSNPMHINGPVRSILIAFGIDRMVGKGWDGVEIGATISSRIWEQHGRWHVEAAVNFGKCEPRKYLGVNQELSIYLCPVAPHFEGHKKIKQIMCIKVLAMPSTKMVA